MHYTTGMRECFTCKDKGKDEYYVSFVLVKSEELGSRIIGRVDMHAKCFMGMAGRELGNELLVSLKVPDGSWK